MNTIRTAEGGVLRIWRQGHWWQSVAHRLRYHLPWMHRHTLLVIGGTEIVCAEKATP